MKRIAWLDILKGFGIIFIVLGHVCDEGIFRKYLFSFHVMLFFIIGGLCFHFSRNIQQFLQKKILRIIIPYFIFSVVSIMIFAVAGRLLPSVVEGIDTDILTGLKVMIYGNSKPDIMKYNSPLWFIPCFFIVNCIAYIIEYINSFIPAVFNGYLNEKINIINVIRIVETSLFVILGIIISKESYCTALLPWHIETAVNMYVFFSIGIILKEYVLNIKLNHKQRTITCIIGIFIIALCFAGSQYNVCVSAREDSYGLFHLYYIFALSGCLSWLLISLSIESNVLLEYIGKNSMPILLMHKFPILMFQKCIPYVSTELGNPNSITGVIFQILVGAISIGLCIVAAKIIRRLFPLVIGEYHRSAYFSEITALNLRK